MTPFDFLNAINLTKKDLIAEDPQAEKEYLPYIVNRGLSYFPDTILYANEMNQRWEAPNEWQFSFFLNTISRKKRFSKWHKKDADTESFRLVQEYFGYSNEKAKEALRILSDEQIAEIKAKTNKGGVK